MSHVTFHASHVTYHILDDIITTNLLEIGSCNFYTLFITRCVLQVTWHISCVICYLPPIICHLSHVAFLKREGDKGKVSASSGWRFCHPLGTSRLVFIQTTIVENLKSATYFRFSKISNFYIFDIHTFIIHTFAIIHWKCCLVLI